MKNKMKNDLFKPTKSHVKEKLKNANILLNDIVKIKLAPSFIDGIGVFALRNLKKGEKIYADAIPNAFDIPYKKFKDLRPDVREIILSHWPNVINGAHFLYPVTKMTAFINHSDDPNYDQVKDEMIKSVNIGEEITVDYKLYPNYKKLFKWL